MTMTREEMQRLASLGRNGDTMLAHINPQEASLLKSKGGSGTINPNTGLPEYYTAPIVPTEITKSKTEKTPVSLGQVLDKNLLKLPSQLTTESQKGYTTGTGIGVQGVAPKTVVSDEYGKYRIKDLGYQPGKGASGAKDLGYAIPVEGAKFQNSDIVAQYDSNGKFLYYTTPPTKKIALGDGYYVKPKINASGELIEYKPFKPSTSLFQDFVSDIVANPITQIALSYYMPGIASSFAPSLASLGVSQAYQNVVANAIVSIATQVSQGVPLDKAIQTATTNAVVSTGSQSVATQLNTVLNNPAVTNAIVSAGSSAAQTAANGGSRSDIENNLVAGLVGSGTATATGSTAAGAAAGGAVSGGVLGALTGAASSLGNTPKDTTTTTTTTDTSTSTGGTGDTGGTSTTTEEGTGGTATTTTGGSGTSTTPDTTTGGGTATGTETQAGTGTTTDTSTETSTGTETGTSTPTGNATTNVITSSGGTESGTPTTTTGAGTDTTSTYTPNIYIYGGSPKPNTYTYGGTSTLGTTLGTTLPFYPQSGTTSGLTSTRGAGEIEGKETGKARKNVWNEASLRLKDALGV